MNKLHVDPALRRSGSAGLAIGLTVAAVVLSGCGSSSEAAPPAFGGAQYAEFIEGEPGAYGDEHARRLNGWLAVHPDERIVSLTAVPLDETNLDGYQAIIEWQPHGGEHCRYADQTAERPDTSGPRAYGAAALQAAIEKRPNDRWIIMSVPPFGRATGVEGYVACNIPGAGPVSAPTSAEAPQ